MNKPLSRANERKIEHISAEQTRFSAEHRSNSEYNLQQNITPRQSDLRRSRSMSATPGPIVAHPEVSNRALTATSGFVNLDRENITPSVTPHIQPHATPRLHDLTFGRVVGRGAYSTVVLATGPSSELKVSSKASSIPSSKASSLLSSEKPLSSEKSRLSSDKPRSASDLSYAVKIINKRFLLRERKAKYAALEKAALVRLRDCPGVVRLHATFQDRESLYFVLEYAPHGDLLALLRRHGSLSRAVTCHYAAQLLSAIGALHSVGVIHRDIKPENVLLDSHYRAKLTDFGTAALLPQTHSNLEQVSRHVTTSFVGTAEYVPPELLAAGHADGTCDLWAWACVVFQLIAGRPPFQARNEFLTFQNVMAVRYTYPPGFPSDLKDLLRRVLRHEPRQRLLQPQITQHQFFAHTDFSEALWDKPPPPFGPYESERITLSSILPLDQNERKHSESSSRYSETTSRQGTRRQSEPNAKYTKSNSRQTAKPIGFVDPVDFAPLDSPVPNELVMNYQRLSHSPRMRTPPLTSHNASALHAANLAVQRSELQSQSNVPRPRSIATVLPRRPRAFSDPVASSDPMESPLLLDHLNTLIVSKYHNNNERIIKLQEINVTTINTTQLQSIFQIASQLHLSIHQLSNASVHVCTSNDLQSIVKSLEATPAPSASVSTLSEYKINSRMVSNEYKQPGGNIFDSTYSKSLTQTSAELIPLKDYRLRTVAITNYSNIIIFIKKITLPIEYEISMRTTLHPTSPLLFIHSKSIVLLPTTTKSLVLRFPLTTFKSWLSIFQKQPTSPPSLHYKQQAIMYPILQKKQKSSFAKFLDSIW